MMVGVECVPGQADTLGGDSAGRLCGATLRGEYCITGGCFFPWVRACVDSSRISGRWERPATDVSFRRYRGAGFRVRRQGQVGSGPGPGLVLAPVVLACGPITRRPLRGPNQRPSRTVGRIAFGAHHAPKHGVWVSSYHAFTDDLGGGEHHHGGQPEAVIEITRSGVYQEQIELAVGPGQRLEVRAAEGTRPVLRLLDWCTNRPDALQIRGLCHPHEASPPGGVRCRRGRAAAPGRPVTLHPGAWVVAGAPVRTHPPRRAEPGAGRHRRLHPDRAQHPRHHPHHRGRGAHRPVADPPDGQHPGRHGSAAARCLRSRLRLPSRASSTTCSSRSARTACASGWPSSLPRGGQPPPVPAPLGSAGDR